MSAINIDVILLPMERLGPVVVRVRAILNSSSPSIMSSAVADSRVHASVPLDELGAKVRSVWKSE